MILEDAESQIIDQQAMGYVFLSAEQFLELFKYIYVIFNGCSMELEKSKNWPCLHLIIEYYDSGRTKRFM